MIASRLMPRSPVWLRKIPSTVSGSQGSRRGLRPAVRFAFPLGAKMYITDFPAAGQGKVRIRAELFRRAGGFRRAVGVFPARAIVTAGALPPILVEEPPQPGGSGDGGRRRELLEAGGRADEGKGAVCARPVIPEGAGALVGRDADAHIAYAKAPFRSMRDADHDSCAARASAPSAGRLDGADEFKRTRKGHRPAPMPLSETRLPSHEPIYPIGPLAPEAKKRGPPSPAGPSGIRGGA